MGESVTITSERIGFIKTREHRRSISGSMIGGMPELQEMLNFCGKHDITSDVEVISAEYINTAYQRTIASDVKYRFVIDASTF